MWYNVLKQNTDITQNKKEEEKWPAVITVLKTMIFIV